MRVSTGGAPVPQPRCDALATMAHAPRWQQCFTVPNLDSFTNYIAFYATAAEVEELVLLPVVYHRGNWDGIATRIPIGVMIKGRWTPLPEAECSGQDCERCRAGRSGYAFYWMDPRWTPEAAIDLTMTHEEMRAESNQPWPRGILQPPLPAQAPRQFLTTMWDFPNDPFER